MQLPSQPPRHSRHDQDPSATAQGWQQQQQHPLADAVTPTARSRTYSYHATLISGTVNLHHQINEEKIKLDQEGCRLDLKPTPDELIISLDSAQPAEYSAACRSTLVLGGECNRTSVGTLLAQLALCKPSFLCLCLR